MRPKLHLIQTVKMLVYGRPGYHKDAYRQCKRGPPQDNLELSNITTKIKPFVHNYHT